jgi:hypothetical protein
MFAIILHMVVIASGKSDFPRPASFQGSRFVIDKGSKAYIMKKY